MRGPQGRQDENIQCPKDVCSNHRPAPHWRSQPHMRVRWQHVQLETSDVSFGLRAYELGTHQLTRSTTTAMKQETREVFLDMRTRHEGATCQTVDSREVRTDGRGREGQEGECCKGRGPVPLSTPPGPLDALQLGASHGPGRGRTRGRGQRGHAAPVFGSQRRGEGLVQGRKLTFESLT